MRAHPLRTYGSGEALLSPSAGPEAVNDENVCTAPIMTDEDILGSVQGSKNIMDAASGDENEINNATPVATTSEMRNIMKSI
ncbi:hypothetical protein TNCV_4717251 [Trichonephila clavipes]|nr:hypothetical protein TNCV_4717251 [Trichonephila clavipes]